MSYLTHEGKRNHAADLTLYERLVTGGHMSPLEHVATPFTEEEWWLRVTLQGKAETLELALQGTGHTVATLSFCGNFRGWTQLRKTVVNEHNFSRLE